MKHCYLSLLTLCVFQVFLVSAQQDSTFQTEGFFVTHDASLIEAAGQQSDGKILVSGHFSHYQGKPVNNLVRLLANGNKDTSFDSSIGTNGYITTIIKQPDGKFLLSGSFSFYKQQAVSTNLIRILPDGVLDPAFNVYIPGGGYSGMTAITLQPDGKIIIAGFGLSPGAANNSFSVIRLNSNGTFDNTFNTQFFLKQNEVINTIGVQKDGRILLGGSFTAWKDISCTGLIRLKNDGSVDTGFHLKGQGFRPAIWGNVPTVHSISINEDSTILVGGNFGYYDNLIRTGVVRLQFDGSVDPSFHPSGPIIPYSIGTVFQTRNNKVIVGGHFYIGSEAKSLVLLNSDGSIDTNAVIAGTPSVKGIFANPDSSFSILGYFNRNFHGHYIEKFTADFHFDTAYSTAFQKKGLVVQTAVQSDGKILVAGDFNQYGINGNNEQNRIARILTNGQLDTSFHASGTSHYTNCVALQPDGDILVAGSFSSVNGNSKKGIARFRIDGTLDSSFNSGTGPNDANMYSLHVQDSQYIYVSGSFGTYDNTIHQGIVRLLWNGEVDQTFDTRGTSIYAPYSVETTTDNKVLAAEGSDRATRNYNTALRLFRLNQDGSPDNSFQTPQLGWSMGYKVKRGKENSIYWMGELIQAATPGSFERTIIRLKENGSLDSSAKRLPSNYYISDFTVLPDSNLLVCGHKIFANEDSTYFIMKLKPDLSIDSTFNPVALYYNLKHINFTPDNRIVVAGEPIRYFRLQNEQMQNVAILKNSAIQLFNAEVGGRVSNMLDTVTINGATTGNSISNSFIIRNPGNQNISLLDPAKVIVTGDNAAEFSIVMENNNAIIKKQDSLRFTLKFSPGSAGQRKARITIPYFNGLDNKYTFVVMGKANITTPVSDIEQNKKGILLYPNPTSNDFVYIRTKKKFQYYSIIDVSGRIIQKGTIPASSSETLTIPIKISNPGIYWLKLTGKNYDTSTKMIVR